MPRQRHEREELRPAARARRPRRRASASSSVTPTTSASATLGLVTKPAKLRRTRRCRRPRRPADWWPTVTAPGTACAIRSAARFAAARTGMTSTWLRIAPAAAGARISGQRGAHIVLANRRRIEVPRAAPSDAVGAAVEHPVHVPPDGLRPRRRDRRSRRRRSRRRARRTAPRRPTRRSRGRWRSRAGPRLGPHHATMTCAPAVASSGCCSAPAPSSGTISRAPAREESPQRAGERGGRHRRAR